MIDFVTFCDYTGTFAFAISGIRLASAKQFDWFGAFVVGVVTAVGGGTLRDVLLNSTPFWMQQPSYLIISALALLFVIIFRKHMITLNNTFFIFDFCNDAGICTNTFQIVFDFYDFFWKTYKTSSYKIYVHLSAEF